MQRDDLDLDIDDLLDLWEAARDRGEPVTPEALCRNRPDLLGEVARLVAELQAADAFLDGPSDDAPIEAPAANRDRYLDERFLAEGGLGRVYIARDAELPREVALKRLQGWMAGSREGRRRFIVEAEITARLEHPGVVPVYGLGADRDGQPFYAMRLIRGETMARAIEKFHADDASARDPGVRSLAMQALLRAFLAACQTIAYAHSKGVIHRDLKPSNVMLGPYGEAIVVDWGLAKAVDDRDEADENGRFGPIHDAAFDATSVGTVKGSPAYMSPEQAEGRVSRVGPSSDVYSLGATLYALLAGVRPIAGKTAAEMLDRVRTGRFPPPRRVKPGVPRALEAVCLKAMELDPERRYAGASELAAEIERWLSGEPVFAWREPWYVRLRRWGRRHRVVVAAAAAAVLVGGVVLVATNGMLRDLARRLDASNVSLRAALDDAERNLYARDVDLADRAWRDGQPARASALLDECPAPRRGWEWRYLARRNRVGLSTAALTAPALALGVAAGGRVVAITAEGAGAYGLSGSIRRAAVSGDGTRVAIVTAERPDEVVVVADGASTRFTPGTAGAVESLAFSADGRAIAMAVVRREGPQAGSKEKLSFVTEFEARLVVRSLDVGRETISAPFTASGSPGTPVLAGGGSGRCFCPVRFGESSSLYVVRPDSPRVTQVWAGEGAVAVSPDGFRLASRGEGDAVVVREVAGGRVVATYRGHAASIRALAFRPDGARLASAADDRTIRLWDFAEGAAPPVVLRGQEGAVDRLAFSADGTRLASATASTVVVWDPGAAPEATVVRLAESPHLVDMAIAPEGRAAVVAGRRLAWRDAATGRVIEGGDEVADVTVVASGGGWTAAGTGEGSIVVLDSQRRIVRTLTGHAAAITALSFSNDGSRLASAARDGEVRLWDVATGGSLGRFQGGAVVALSPDGASAAVDGGIVGATTGSLLHLLAGSDRPVRRLAYSPDGAMLAVVRPSGGGVDLSVHDAATGALLYAVGDQAAGVTDAVFSPDALRLATADRAGEVVIREASTGRPLLRLHGPSHSIERLAFTPDGDRLLAAGGRVDPLGLGNEETGEFTIWDGRSLD